MFGNRERQLQGKEKANYLVREIGKRVHAADSSLDADNDRSFGEFGFHFDSGRNVLTERIFIGKAYLDFDDPKKVANFRRMPEVLNDPTKGGLFEHGGGTFILDEKRQKYFLTKEFPVDSPSVNDLWQQTEYLTNLEARWSMKWLGHVARIMHGWEQPPTRPMTLKDDPYPRN